MPVRGEPTGGEVIQITANDIETEPGIGMTVGEMQLRRDLARIRRERDEARQELALSDRSSVPPPTRKQQVVGVGMGAVKWVGVATLLLTALAEIASTYRPDVVGPIQTVIKLLGGLG